MKKIIAILLTLALLLCALAGCGAAKPADAPQKGGPAIVATIFPAWDWAREILGDNPAGAELTLLLDDGVDLHSYQPTVDDMVKISACDVFIYVGGESDEWVTDALATAKNPNMIVIDLLDVLGEGAKTEETVEGMQEEEHHRHDGEDEDHDENHEEHEEETEYDEHVWLSLKNAERFCRVIAERLGEIDPANADAYSANAGAYCEKLAALDARYHEAVQNAKHRTLLFGDRFPFRYLTEDYGLDYYAAFSGCSAETEASFETVIFLAEKLDELRLPAVLTIETGDGRVAERIVETSNSKSAEVLPLDSLQSTTLRDALGGKTYLTAMEQNLAVLQKSLD